MCVEFLIFYTLNQKLLYHIVYSLWVSIFLPFLFHVVVFVFPKKKI